MSWPERLRFWLWHFWLEHPVILVITLSIAVGAYYEYRRYSGDDFWDEGYHEASAEMTSFSTVLTRHGRYMMVGIHFDDGTDGSVAAYKSQLDGCRVGDRITVQRKEDRMRSTGKCIKDR